MGLTKSQQAAFDAYVNGKDLYIHGDSGTGKSYLVQTIVADATQRGLNIVVLAPTGKAAKNVDGMTLHSFFHFPVGILDSEQIYYGRTDRNHEPFINQVDVVVIDEISMVRYDIFGAVMRSIQESDKKRHHQVIVVGDFYQLPPVLDLNKDGEAYTKLYGAQIYAFLHPLFRRLVPVHLTEVVRQKDDIEFMNLLNLLRIGDASVLDRLPVAPASNTAVTLCATNKQAEAINCRMLKSLPGPTVTYKAISSGVVHEEDKFAPEILELAPGAHVLMCVNDTSNRWHNGSDATIVETREDEVLISVGGVQYPCTPVTQKITKSQLVPVPGGENGKKLKVVQIEIGSYTQLPLKLGWAITIHKSQGMTLDEVNIDPSGCRNHGQLYVAVSRCRTLQGLHLMSRPVPEDLICDAQVKEFMQTLDTLDTCGSIFETADNGVPLPDDVELSSQSDGTDTGTNACRIPFLTRIRQFICGFFKGLFKLFKSVSGATETETETGTVAVQTTEPATTETEEQDAPAPPVTIPCPEQKSLEDIKLMVKDNLRHLLLENGYPEESMQISLVTAQEAQTKKSASEQWQSAKKQRISRLQHDLESLDIETRKRLVVASNNAQSVYHLLYEHAGATDKACVTVRAISETLGLSDRSVTSAMAELRDAGLISSPSSKKVPEITISKDFASTTQFEHCLLYMSIKTKSGRKRMQNICSQCDLTSCPAHPNNKR